MVRLGGARLGGLFLGLALGGVLGGTGARGGSELSERPSEYRIKAAYLYYFGTFVSWPDEASSRVGDDLIVGILGADPFGEILEGTLAGKRIEGRALVIRRFDSIQDARRSHILFISSSEKDDLPHILKVLEGSAVLTVGEAGEFAARGGQIGFVTEKDKVRFEINVAAVRRAGLRMSSQLIKLGRIVEPAGREGG